MVASAAALVALALSALVVVDQGGGGRVVDVAATAPSAPADTTIPAGTTSTAPPPVPSPVPQVGAPTTVASRRTSTTVAPPSRAPAAAAMETTSTTTATSELTNAPCGPGRITVAVAPEQPTFGPGEKVVITTTARNHTSEPCSYFSYTMEATFKDATGRPLGGMVAHADAFQRVALLPGAVLTQRAEWNGRNCLAGPDGCVEATPGEYQVTASWRFDSSGVEATATFRLEG
jgi:hypothetical protein